MQVLRNETFAKRPILAATAKRINLSHASHLLTTPYLKTINNSQGRWKLYSPNLSETRNFFYKIISLECT